MPPLDLHFELRLEERQADRVFVSVVLAPTSPDGSGVEGVSVQMVDRQGEVLGARLVLPISGTIAQPLLTTVEVRSRGPVPVGARVVGQAWRGDDQSEATCPCDPGTQLQVHMLGRKTIPLPERPGDLRFLVSDEREVLGRFMPWLNEPRPRPVPEPNVLEPQPPTPDDLVDEVAEQYDLDPADAEFLRELLGEE